MPVNIEGFRSRLNERIIAGLAQVGQELEESAKKNAPVSKSSRRRTALADITVSYGPVGHYTSAEIAEGRGIGQSMLVSKGKLGKVQQDIRPIFIEDKSAKRHAKRVSKGTAAKERGGHLRDSIHALQPEVEGTRIVVRVRAEAPYAKFVEFGFTHKGGKEIQGRSFMRRALHEDVRSEGASGIAKKIGKTR